MENFKINRYEEQENEQNSFEQFETLSLEHLNEERRFSLEQKQGIEAAREQGKAESREQLMDLYERIEQSGRENSSFFDGRNKEVAENVVYFEDYGTSFENFEGVKGFEHRPNMNLSQDELSKELTAAKSEIRTVSFSQKMSNFTQALGFRKSA